METRSMRVGRIIRDLTEAINRGEYPSERQKTSLIRKVEELRATSPRGANILEDALGRLGITEEKITISDDEEEVETAQRDIGWQEEVNAWWEEGMNLLHGMIGEYSSTWIETRATEILEKASHLASTGKVSLDWDNTFIGKLYRNDVGLEGEIMSYAEEGALAEAVMAYSNSDEDQITSAFSNLVLHMYDFSKWKPYLARKLLETVMKIVQHPVWWDKAMDAFEVEVSCQRSDEVGRILLYLLLDHFWGIGNYVGDMSVARVDYMTLISVISGYPEKGELEKMMINYSLECFILMNECVSFRRWLERHFSKEEIDEYLK